MRWRYGVIAVTVVCDLLIEAMTLTQMFYAVLTVALTHLEDPDNAAQAYEQAIQLEQ